MTYGGSNPPLCTIPFPFRCQEQDKEQDVDLSPAGSGRMIVALVAIGLIALLAWSTLDPGKPRNVTFVLLGFAAIRVVLGRQRKR